MVAAHVRRRLRWLLPALVLVATACSAEIPIEVTTTLVSGSGLGPEARQALRIESPAILDETIDHVAIVNQPDEDIWLFHFDQTTLYCTASGGGLISSSCSSNDPLTFDRPFLRRAALGPSGRFHTWISNATPTSAFFVVETDTGTRFASAIVRDTGYAIVDDGSTPVEAFLIDADGAVIWTDEIRS